MGWFLLILFIGLPLLEVALLVKLGGWLGVWPTIGLVIGTGVVGAGLARVQGWLVWRRLQEELRAGRLPAESLVDGVLIFVGGILLMTPGVVTDLLGLALLVPWSRWVVKQWLRQRFERARHGGRAVVVRFR